MKLCILSYNNRWLYVTIVVILLFLCPSTCFSIELKTEQETSLQPAEPITAPDYRQLTFGLSEDQVRKMLIEELRKETQEESVPTTGMKGPAEVLRSLFTSLNKEYEEDVTQFSRLWSGVPGLLPALLQDIKKLAPRGTLKGALKSILWVVCFISFGLLVEILFRVFFLSKYFKVTPNVGASLHLARDKLITCFTLAIPKMLGIIIFFISAYFSFMLLIWTDLRSVQQFFIAVLIAYTAIRIIYVTSWHIFLPYHANLRITPMDCRSALFAHRLLTGVSSYIILALVSAVIVRQLGAELQTVRLLQLFFATVLLAAMSFLVLRYRHEVRNHILGKAVQDQANISLSRKQVASSWHILMLAYLFFLWLLLLNSMADPQIQTDEAFILSFFALPLWILVDRLTQRTVKYCMRMLKIHQDEYEDHSEPDEEIQLQRQKGKELYLKLNWFSRLVVVVVLTVWIAKLWRIHIPFFSDMVAVLIDSLVMVALALLFWQVISSWIENKIQETTPEEEEDKEDDEWGGAAARGRAYTLLPMIRKFIGSILVVMVILTILSNMGVNIGPLIAGAGVAGIAIGFGSQKLVSDMFSGFFYLLDDAFRVGEYIEAGSVSGTIEAITLRNVMLRHHRGMLQTVPHSDLGAITNYMRGGIVVKFALDFPYDAPIDTIRKIIKRVGQEMLENEEYGEDFIRPLKSQGVREITDSVMTIRAKFTAKPGTHFVIRREAYRLLTEALNARGIYYAHKRVIVDLAESTQNIATEEAPAEQPQLSSAVAAGAAAIQISKEEAPSPTGNQNNIGNS